MKSEPLGWRPGLEGLRGVAILMVMLFHFEATRHLFPGGSLGVDIFFVLSGFLITTLLLEERSRTGAVSLSSFYRRRARRLLPALVAFLAVFAAVTIITNQPGVYRLPATILASLVYGFNWLLSFGGQGTGGAGHIWSLSVEEQFYLVWPVAVIIALRISPRALLFLSLAVFVLSASLPAWSGRGYEALYYGTDFRVQGLMVGALLAQLRFAGVFTPSVVNRAPFRAALMLSVAVLGVFLFGLEDRVAFLYAGLYTAVAVIAAVLVYAVLYAPPRILTNRLILYVGTRSYALYLWHNPIAFWLRDMDATLALALSFALSFAAAEASWRLVEGRASYLFRLPNIIRERLTPSDAEPADIRPSIAVEPRQPASESNRPG